jgi:hypothetical protein
MSFLKLVFKPGINRDQTNYSGEGGWSDCDKVRFFSGFPQKLGGWQKATPNLFIGVCRQVWNWVTSFTDNFLGVGTDIKLYIEVGGEFYDITPLRATLATPDTDDCIETTSGSTTITVNVTAHGCLSGDYVTISGVTGDVGGVPDAEINAEHVITRVDDDIFTFTVATPAGTTVATGGGSSIDIECQIHPGYPLTTAGYGWGAGFMTATLGGVYLEIRQLTYYSETGLWITLTTTWLRISAGVLFTIGSAALQPLLARRLVLEPYFFLTLLTQIPSPHWLCRLQFLRMTSTFWPLGASPMQVVRPTLTPF